jgi:hypothetical protein
MGKRSKAREAFQQKRRKEARKSRVKKEKTPPLPLEEIRAQHKVEPTTLLTRKVTGKRTLSATRAKPTGYTSLTKTGKRDKEQSRKRIFNPLKHSTQPRSLLLDQRRQKRVEGDVSSYIWYPPEKHKIHRLEKTAKRVRLMTIYPHDGWSQVDFEESRSQKNCLRERM